MTIYLKVSNEHIEDIKFQTFGCGAAIAVSSMLTEIAKGKSIDEAKRITNKDVAMALEGLPKNKLHCSNLGADALQLALKDFEGRKPGKTHPELLPKNHHKPSNGDKCYCPIVTSRWKQMRRSVKHVSRIWKKIISLDNRQLKTKKLGRGLITFKNAVILLTIFSI